MKKYFFLLLFFSPFFIISCSKNPSEQIFYDIEHHKNVKLQTLIKKYPQILNQFNSQGENPLHVAAEKGNEEAIDIILGTSFNVDSPTADGKTPLMLTINSGYYNIAVKLVTRYKANIHTTDKIGATPAFIAYSTNQTEILNFLLKNGATKLEMVTESSNTDKNDLSLSNNLFTKNENGLTELFQKNSPLNIIQDYMTKNPVNFTKTDAEGNTVLHIASLQTDPGVLQFILSMSKINPNAINNKKQTPLMLAIQNKNIENIKILILANSSLQAVDDQQQTVLHYAALSDDLITVNLILYNYHNINVKDFLSITPLDIACSKGNLDIIHRLLESGADPNIVSRDKGYTSLHFAIEGGNQEVLSLLLKFGANKTIPDLNNELPKDLAKKLKKNALADLL